MPCFYLEDLCQYTKFPAGIAGVIAVRFTNASLMQKSKVELHMLADIRGAKRKSDTLQIANNDVSC